MLSDKELTRVSDKDVVEWATDGNEEVSVVEIPPYVVAYETAVGRKPRPGELVQVDDVNRPTKIYVKGKWIKI